MADSSTHHEIYRRTDRYAGWPANYGMWSWNDEIVLVFTSGFPDPNGGFHARDRSKPLETMQARSLDGGETWSVAEAPLAFGIGLGTYEHMNKQVIESFDPVRFEIPENLDLTHPEFAVMCGKTGLIEGAKSWFYTSYDRCHKWQGPFELPMFGQLGIAARTDWLIDGPTSATLLLTATKPDGGEGRIFACRTEDGGNNFEFISWINDAPTGYDIMPSSLRLSDGSILTAIRSQGAQRDDCWIDLYRSRNDARAWDYVSRPVASTGDGGNPPSLVKLEDGRLVITYGSRKPPYGIFCVISEDEGASWSSPMLLRSSGGNHDIGYTRSVLRNDGKLVTAYYINDDGDGERFIEATITEF
jgi:hypothetical protein